MPKQSHIWIDGAIARSTASPLSVSNRAFKYGDGIFESLKVHGGKILFADQHFARLLKGMQTLGFSFDEDEVKSQWDTGIQAILKAASIENFGRLRVQVFRRGGGAYSPEENGFHLHIEGSSLASDPWLGQKPLRISWYHEVPLAYTLLSGLKTCNALPYVLAARKAQETGWDDLLLFGPGGIAESSRANLFLLGSDGQTLLTPSLHYGGLPGIMRRQVMLMAEKLGILVKEVQVTRESFQEAKEVFLTNVIRGIQSVGVVDQMTFPQTQVADRLRTQMLKAL